MHFIVTTPVYNGARYIDETILSVASQAGAFTVAYHVQDGGSTDGTLEKLRQWKALLETAFPLLCERFTFSYASAPDAGLYDAVNKGFLACGAGDVMTWINADDRIEVGAFSSVAQILTRFPSVDWLCGQGAIIDDAGAMMLTRRGRSYPRKSIANGVYDLRNAARIIMQEGSFWRSSLWQDVGGLDIRLKLAGDFDLWRRFAEHSDLVVVASVFGLFRSRAGQLSGDISAYQIEVDNSLPVSIKSRRRVSRWVERFGFFTYRHAFRKYKTDWHLGHAVGISIGHQKFTCTTRCELD